LSAPAATSALSLHDALPICFMSRGLLFTMGCSEMLRSFWKTHIVPSIQHIIRRACRMYSSKARQVVDLSLQRIVVDVEKLLMMRSEEHTSELQSRFDLVCSL